jgi:hypothetical protein
MGFRDNPDPAAVTNYGVLGPGADVTADRQPIIASGSNWRFLAAVVVGATLALALVAIGGFRSAGEKLASFSRHENPAPTTPAILSEREIGRLDHEHPQQQALLLLQHAVNHIAGANDQIAARLEPWRGKLTATPQMNQLINTALDSDDVSVRTSAIEVELIVHKIDKNNESAEHWIGQAKFGSQAERVWGFWILGLLANRGIEQEQVTQALIGQLRDPDPSIRGWAVEALYYTGTDVTIAPLLKALHDDPSSAVRDRAACGLGQCGMWTPEQRKIIVPKLIEFAEDISLDAQTHGYIYHALRDLTGQNLPEDPAAWRNWYNTSGQT